MTIQKKTIKKTKMKKQEKKDPKTLEFSGDGRLSPPERLSFLGWLALLCFCPGASGHRTDGAQAAAGDAVRSDGAAVVPGANRGKEVVWKEKIGRLWKTYWRWIPDFTIFHTRCWDVYLTSTIVFHSNGIFLNLSTVATSIWAQPPGTQYMDEHIDPGSGLWPLGAAYIKGRWSKQNGGEPNKRGHSEDRKKHKLINIRCDYQAKKGL